MCQTRWPTRRYFVTLWRGGVDHRDAVGGPERDEGGLVVLGHADADRLDRLAPQARNLEGDLAGHHVLCRIDDRDGAADLGGNPQFGTVVLEFGKARPRIDQHVGDDLARRGVDEMRHVGGLGGVDQDLAVRADRHALGLDADLDVADASALLEIDDGDRVVVLVGDVEDLAGGILGEQLRDRGRRAGCPPPPAFWCRSSGWCRRRRPRPSRICRRA